VATFAFRPRHHARRVEPSPIVFCSSAIRVSPAVSWHRGGRAGPKKHDDEGATFCARRPGSWRQCEAWQRPASSQRGRLRHKQLPFLMASQLSKQQPSVQLCYTTVPEHRIDASGTDLVLRRWHRVPMASWNFQLAPASSLEAGASWDEHSRLPCSEISAGDLVPGLVESSVQDRGILALKLGIEARTSDSSSASTCSWV